MAAVLGEIEIELGARLPGGEWVSIGTSRVQVEAEPDPAAPKSLVEIAMKSSFAVEFDERLRARDIELLRSQRAAIQ